MFQKGKGRNRAGERTGETVRLPAVPAKSKADATSQAGARLSKGFSPWEIPKGNKKCPAQPTRLKTIVKAWWIWHCTTVHHAAHETARNRRRYRIPDNLRQYIPE